MKKFPSEIAEVIVPWPCGCKHKYKVKNGVLGERKIIELCAEHMEDGA